jgi:hypothetical protein
VLELAHRVIKLIGNDVDVEFGSRPVDDPSPGSAPETDPGLPLAGGRE